MLGFTFLTFYIHSFRSQILWPSLFLSRNRCTTTIMLYTPFFILYSLTRRLAHCVPFIHVLVVSGVILELRLPTSSNFKLDSSYRCSAIVYNDYFKAIQFSMCASGLICTSFGAGKDDSTSCCVVSNVVNSVS